ncbi:MAG: hypothetical protein WDO73_05425 [Ignavibacteriota bacterium]
MRIDFNEQFAHHLKLTVVDDRNPPLQIGSVNVLSAARQIVFRGAAGAIRLYYGNPEGHRCALRSPFLIRRGVFRACRAA